jgi:hypothetical protein
MQNKIYPFMCIREKCLIKVMKLLGNALGHFQIFPREIKVVRSISNKFFIRRIPYPGPGGTLNSLRTGIF